MDASENGRVLSLRFVSGVYDEAGGTDDRPVDARLVAQKSLGSDLDAATQALVLHLQGQGLIRVVSMANGVVRLTAEGARVVEEARATSTAPTEPFAPADVAYAESGTDAREASPVPEDDPETTRSPAVVEQSIPSAMKEFVLELKEALNRLDLEGRLELDEDRLSELAAEIRTIEAQMGSPRPKAQIVRLSLESIEGIMEGSTDNAVTEKIASTIDAFITSLS
ncbi:MAG: hypothetical protein M3R38_36505 [Actinomycetota bacterium]|nr:hypothetical protein [Actinomycetota bacterium]